MSTVCLCMVRIELVGTVTQLSVVVFRMEEVE